MTQRFLERGEGQRDPSREHKGSTKSSQTVLGAPVNVLIANDVIFVEIGS